MQKGAIKLKKSVYVTVYGGVAYPEYVPEDVQLHIIDFDNLKADRDATLAGYSVVERDFVVKIEAKRLAEADRTGIEAMNGEAENSSWS